MVRIQDIENIIIQQGSHKYKLINKNNEWVFLDLENNEENGGYNKEDAYKVIVGVHSRIISIPNKTKKYELWK